MHLKTVGKHNRQKKVVTLLLPKKTLSLKNVAHFDSQNFFDFFFAVDLV